MRKKIIAVMSVLFSALFLFSTAVPATAEGEGNQLKFNDNGKFTILQIADTQDIFIARPATIEAMKRAIERVKPDLIVFTGDNIQGYGAFTEGLAKMAIKKIMKPVTDSGVPFTVTFGNHDDEGKAISKEKQLAVFQSYKGCLAFDDNAALYGCANHNLTIKNSAGTADAFNLYIVDSGSYDTVGGGYDYVREDQLEWYKQTSEALEAANGVKVPSLWFQHIPIPEIYELYNTAPEGAEGSRERFGVNRAFELNSDMASGILGEWSCPPDANHGQFDAMLSRGDCLGIVFGHDHVNSFTGTYKGIDLIQSPAIGYFSYGNQETRGVRVFELDENDSSSYKTYTILNKDLYKKGWDEFLHNRLMGGLMPYISNFVGQYL